MHAIRLHAFGPAENLIYEEVPDPVPGGDQVQIAVEASGVHLGLTVTAAVGPRMLQRPGGLRDFENQALEAVAAGQLVPLVGQRFPLTQAAAAHAAIEARATRGKTVLVPGRLLGTLG